MTLANSFKEQTCMVEVRQRNGKLLSVCSGCKQVRGLGNPNRNPKFNPKAYAKPNAKLNPKSNAEPNPKPK